MSAQKWAILLLVTALLLTSACAVASAANTQGGVVQINSPSKNGKAGPTQPVSGKAQLSKGYALWIVPYDPTAGIYYPQAPSLTVRSDATWSTRLSVGNIFGVGKVFQIHAVVANPSASNALNNYAAQRTGIAKLPAGAQAVDAVTVTRVAADVASTASASPSPTTVSRTTSAVTSSATAKASPSATTVAGVSSGVMSSNPLPGFEAVFALGALGALAAIYVVIRWTRQR
jgi:hypothetical protein